MKNGLIVNEYGTKRYYVNDQLHREDGPAIEYAGGTKCWYYKDIPIHCESLEEFKRLVKLRMFM